MAAPADNASSPLDTWRRDLLWLAIGFGLLFFFRLGSYPLGNPDEGRNAEIPREMLATGDWATPRLNGVNYFEKPPLVYWTTGAALKIFGPAEWAMRSTPALFALAGVLLTYAAGRQLHSRAAGLIAAVVLGTSLFYFIVAHVLVLDMAVSVLMSATLFCFILAVREPGLADAGEGGTRRRCLFYGLYASAALATLTKGLIGFLVTGAVMFLWLLVFNQWRRLRPMYLPTGILLFLAIAAPWHIVAALRNETWLHRYLVYEHFERFLTPVASRPGPLWYFVPIVIAGLFPWSGFLFSAGRAALSGGWKNRRVNADALFFVTWVAFVFFFFSISKSKLPPYILPVFPAIAVMIGAWLAPTLEDDDPAIIRVGLGVFSFICALLAAALLVVVARPELVKLSANQIAALRVSVYAMVTILVAGGIVVPVIATLRGIRVGLIAMAAAMAVFFVALQSAGLPEIMKPGTKSLALLVRERAQPGDRVLHYHEFFHDVTFYAQRIVDVVAFKGELELEEDAAARASGRFIDEPAFRRLWTESGRMFVVARKRDVNPRKNGETTLFTDPSFKYHLLGETEDHVLFTNQPATTDRRE